MLPDLEALGIDWILLDWGWFMAEGDWQPNSDIFADEADFGSFVTELQARGFRVGLWFQPIQVDPTDDEVDETLLPYAIRNRDGSLFLDDDDLALLDPSFDQVRTYVTPAITYGTK